MFDIDFSGGRILVEKRPYTRPGEVLYKADGARWGLGRVLDDVAPGTNPLDAEDAVALHRKLLAIYRYELERQAENRAEMALDEDMYDHIQWTAEEIAILEERGQTPTVFNIIQTTINWVLGSQRRAQMDYKILPRRKEGLKAAERKDELLRHLRDENDSPTEAALAFADAVKAGIGWLETGEGDPADGPTVFDRYESWRNMLWDSRATRLDLSDARYVCRTKWLDLDIVTELWPDRAGLLERSTEQNVLNQTVSDYGDEAMDSAEDDSNVSAYVTAGGESQRRRVRGIEMWFKKPMRVPVIRGGDFSRELFDPWSDGHWQDIRSGRATLVDQPREVMHVALMTEAGLLDVRQSPYRHNRFPFTPIWGYRRGRDGMPYGMIRGLRDIQRDLNKRASKALHHLSATRVSVQEGSVDDIETLRNEAARPDAVLVYKQGYQPPAIATDLTLADAHIKLMSMDASMIQQVGGVTDENLGRTTNATSGRAILARQDQGQLATSMFFDNFRKGMREHGVKKLINIEQFYTDQQQFRITNARGNPEYVTINDGTDESAIALFKADYVIAEEDWRATTRQAQAEQLLQLMKELAATAPMIVIQCLDLVVEALDVPKRDEIVKRIRQTTGVADPDEDPNNPSPETQAQKAAAAAQAAMAQRDAQATIAEKEAKAAKVKAEAIRNLLGLRSDNLDQINAAIDAAIKIGGAPAVGAAVDGLMQLATEQAASVATMADAPEQMPTADAGATSEQPVAGAM